MPEALFYSETQERDERGRWTSGADPAGNSEGYGRATHHDTVEAADAWGQATQGWATSLTPDQEKALAEYTTHVGINDELRGSRPLNPEVLSRNGISNAQAVPLLDSVFSKPEAAIHEDVVTHRAWIGFRDKAVGAEFTDRGFTSTALALTNTEDFKSVSRGGGLKDREATMVDIRVPAGTRALYLGHAPEGKTWYAASTELLLDRGTRYRVIEKHPGRYDDTVKWKKWNRDGTVTYGKGKYVPGKIVLEVVGQRGGKKFAAEDGFVDWGETFSAEWDESKHPRDPISTETFDAKPAASVSLTDEYGDELASAFETAYKEAGAHVASLRGAEAALENARAHAENYGRTRGGEMITDIDETTRDRVGKIVGNAMRDGLSEQDVRGPLKRLFGETRADLIARTETSTAYNVGTIRALRDAGEEYVYVSDPCECGLEICDVDGEIWTLEEAEANVLGHPNCGRDFRPLTAEELAEVKADEGDDEDSIGGFAARLVRIEGLLRQRFDFDEEKHPRDEHGRFTDAAGERMPAHVEHAPDMIEKAIAEDVGRVTHGEGAGGSTGKAGFYIDGETIRPWNTVHNNEDPSWHTHGMIGVHSHMGIDDGFSAPDVMVFVKQAREGTSVAQIVLTAPGRYDMLVKLPGSKLDDLKKAKEKDYARVLRGDPRSREKWYAEAKAKNPNVKMADVFRDRLAGFAKEYGIGYYRGLRYDLSDTAKAKYVEHHVKFSFDEDAHPRDDHGRFTDGGGSYTEGVPANVARMFKEDKARGIVTRGMITYEGKFDDHLDHVRAAMKAAGYKEVHGMELELDGVKEGAELQYVKDGKELNVYMRSNGRVTALTADETPMDTGGHLHTTDNFIPQHLHDALLPSRAGKKFSGEFEESKHPRDERGRWTDGESMYEGHASLPTPMRDLMTQWSNADRGFDQLRAAGPGTLFWTTLEEMPSYTGAAFRGALLSDAELKALTEGKEFNVSLHSSWSKSEDVAHEEFLSQAGEMQRLGAGRAVLIELESHGGVRDVENFVAPDWKDQREVISPIGLRLERVGGVTKGTMRGPSGTRFEYTRVKVREVRP